MMPSQALRSLRHRNFRLYFIGQLISMTGTWMQITAQMWLVYRLTHSAALLGLVGFAGSAPYMILGLFGGAAADRYDRRKLLLWTQVAAMVQALILAALTMSGHVRVWEIFILAAALGMVSVFDMPLRQIFVVDLVERADQGNAIALNSFIINGSRMIGPALAGLLTAVYGEGICFLLNAVSYLAVISCLVAMSLPPAKEDAGREHISFAHVRQGLHYVFSKPHMKRVMGLLAVLGLVGAPFVVLIPIFSDEIFHAGVRGTGWLVGAMGVGALASSWLLASREDCVGLKRLIGISAIGFGFAMGLFALSRRLESGLLLMAFTGWGMMSAFVASNTYLQASIEDHMRGRVMSLFTMTFMGMAPLGNLLAGMAADVVGAPTTVAFGGVLCVLSGLAFLRQN